MKKTVGILSLFLITLNLAAASLKVSPGGFIVHDIKPGVTYNLRELTGIKLSIYNDDETTHTFALSVNKPSVAGKWEKGYNEIPDPSWCWFKTTEATIGPRKISYGNLFFRIPERDSLYNQHWVAALGIMGKQERGIGFGLGIYVRIQIETESSADSKSIPEGITAFKPSLVMFENVLPGTRKTAKVIVYNNDTRKHTYTINYLSEDKERPASAYLAHGFESLPDPSWIAPEKESFEIAAGGSFVLKMKLNIPDRTEYYDKKWEEILFVEPETGLSGFVRIRITTGKKDSP